MGWAIDHRWIVIGVAIAAPRGRLAARRHAHAPRLLSEGPLVPLLRRRLAPRGRDGLRDTREGGRGRARGRTRPSLRGDAKQGRKEPILRSITEFDRRWRSAVLVLRLARAACSRTTRSSSSRSSDKDDTASPRPRIAGGAVEADRRRARRRARSSRPASPSAFRSRTGYPVRTSNSCAPTPSGERKSCARRRAPSACAMTGAPTRSRSSSTSTPTARSLASVTNHDVAASSAVAINGAPVGTFRDRRSRDPDHRAAPRRRARTARRLQNLYVLSANGTQKVPLGEVSQARLRAPGREAAPAQPAAHDHGLCVSSRRRAPGRGPRAASADVARLRASLRSGLSASRSAARSRS